MLHGHDGSFQGFEAILTRYIEEDLTIIALANLAEVDLAQVTQHLAELMRQETVRDVYAGLNLKKVLDLAVPGRYQPVRRRQNRWVSLCHLDY
jgi:hypothetical protein